MDAELLKILFESASGTTILALGIWVIISRMRNKHIEPTEKYVTKHMFYETVNENRKLADNRHTAELKAIQDVGKEFREELNQTNQNHLDHVAKH